MREEKNKKYYDSLKEVERLNASIFDREYSYVVTARKISNVDFFLSDSYFG